MSNPNNFKDYLRGLQDTYLSGEATELSYYPILKEFLEEYAKQNGISVEVISNPKKTEGGLPDFLLKQDERTIGYIEAKDVSLTNLNKISKSSQLTRYRKCLPNLMLTNFREFILFRDGIQKNQVEICDMSTIIEKKHITPDNVKELVQLLSTFLSYSIPTVYKAKRLAKELAKRTILLNNSILEEMNEGNLKLLDSYEAFRTELMKSLTKEKFSDMYSQTIIYGLFFARIEAKNKLFTKNTAYSYIPSTMPLLQNMFYIITGPNLPQSLAWILDDVVTLLTNINIRSIMKDFHTKIWTKDPVIHFYETFLEEYNPDEKQRRGVFYTPAPVVSYIISSIHQILKKHFAKEGLADNDVTLLDPAAGTLTFPTTAIRLLYDEFKSTNRQGMFNNLVKQHILKHFFALELMIAPYAIGHFKANMVLEDLGYTQGGFEKIPFYLTNTLEMKEPTQITFIPALAREGKKAQEVKQKTPILVICGNPPYSISSDNKSEFIEKLVDDYKEDVRTEKNIHPLSDDYVKFIRFAQWKIEQLGHGVIGYITNNTYLSGLVHRGIRKKLLEAFDEIYILNLHGNSIISEKTPNGTKDENVFDIRVGVAISLFIKKLNGKKDGMATVYYNDVWGLTDEKYDYLIKNNVFSTKWTIIEPKEPYFFLVPKDFQEEENYKRFWSIFDILKMNKIGVCTKRDKFITAFEGNILKTKIKSLLNKDLTKEDITNLYGLNDTYEWDFQRALNSLRKKGYSDNLLIKYSYRPFDIRYIYYENFLIARSVQKVMKHLQKENIGLVLGRAGQNVKYHDWDLVFVTELTTDINLFYRGGATVFPLFIYKNGKKSKNISKEFKEIIEKEYKESVTPEEIFYYIYGVLHSNIFRRKYNEFLTIDFPRIPFTTDLVLFRKIAQLGEKLCEMHLLKSSSPSRKNCTYPQKGDDVIRKVKYDGKHQRVYINKNQYFGNVPSEVWQYHVGGYQVLYKWLKDKKNKKLGYSEQLTYMKIVSALKNTILIQTKIDKIYPKIEKHLLDNRDLNEMKDNLLIKLLKQDGD